MKYYLNDAGKIENCIEFIRGLPTGKGFHVTISDKKPRSLGQNDLWHKWIDEMAKASGSEPAQMKIDVKREILGMKEVINTLTGEISYHDYSSAKLNKEQFSRLMIQTQVIAAEYYGLQLPTLEDYK